MRLEMWSWTVFVTRHSQEERRRMKEDIERRRMEAAERMKSLSTSNVDGDEMFSPVNPKAPTHKVNITNRSFNYIYWSSLRLKSFEQANHLLTLALAVVVKCWIRLFKRRCCSHKFNIFVLARQKWILSSLNKSFPLVWMFVRKP